MAGFQITLMGIGRLAVEALLVLSKEGRKQKNRKMHSLQFQWAKLYQLIVIFSYIISNLYPAEQVLLLAPYLQIRTLNCYVIFPGSDRSKAAEPGFKPGLWMPVTTHLSLHIFLDSLSSLWGRVSENSKSLSISAKYFVWDKRLNQKIYIKTLKYSSLHLFKTHGRSKSKIKRTWA